MKNSSNKKFIFFLLLIHLAFFVAQIFLQNYEMSDSKDYQWMAKNISKGELYCGDLNETLNPDLYTKRPPLYPFFLFLSNRIIHHPFFVLFIQNILSFFSLLWIRNSLSQYAENGSFDKFFLILSLLSPAQFIYANMIMAEIFFQFLLVAMFLQLFLFIHKNKLRHLLYYHILLSLGLLTKPILFPFAFISLAFILFLTIKGKSAILLIYSLLPIVVILLYLNFNEARTSVRHFSSIQKINLIDYNLSYYLRSSKGIKYADSVVSKIKSESNMLNTYEEKYTFTMQKGKEIISRNLLSYSIYHMKASWRLFIDPGRFDLSTFLGLEEVEGNGIFHHLNTSGWYAVFLYLFSQNVFLLLTLVLILLFNIFKVIGFFFFLTDIKIPLEIRLFLLLLFLYFAGVTGSIAASRFMVPVLPIMIGIVAIEFSNSAKLVKLLERIHLI